MDETAGNERPPAAAHKEFAFVPRIINSVRVRDVVVFAAEELVRDAHAVIVTKVPWAEVRVLSDPVSVAEVRSEGPLVLVLDDTSVLLTDVARIRCNNPDVIIVLLSFNEQVHCMPPGVARQRFPHTAKADLVFAVNRNDLPPERIISSAVRAAEDLLNIRKHGRVRRFVFLVVDDEPRWFSQFLPVLYSIIGQRAAVRVTRTYEETIRFLFDVEGES